MYPSIPLNIYSRFFPFQFHSFSLRCFWKETHDDVWAKKHAIQIHSEVQQQWKQKLY